MKDFDSIYQVFNISRESYANAIKVIHPILDKHLLVLYNTIKASDLTEKEKEVAIFIVGFRDGLKWAAILDEMADFDENDKWLDDEGEEWKRGNNE
jgi:hypothetical protein